MIEKLLCKYLSESSELHLGALGIIRREQHGALMDETMGLLYAPVGTCCLLPNDTKNISPEFIRFVAVEMDCSQQEAANEVSVYIQVTMDKVSSATTAQALIPGLGVIQKRGNTFVLEPTGMLCYPSLHLQESAEEQEEYSIMSGQEPIKKACLSWMYVFTILLALALLVLFFFWRKG